MKKQNCTLISIGGGANQKPLISSALDEGHSVCIVDRENFCFPESDAVTHITASTWEPEAILQNVSSKNICGIQGVLSRNSGPATLSASRVANALNLPGIPYEFAQCSVSKAYLRTYLDKIGLPFIPGALSNNLDSWNSYPVIIKPDQPKIGKENVYKTHDIKSDRMQLCLNESINGLAEVSTWIDGIDITLMLNISNKKHSHFIFEEKVGIFNNKIYGIGLQVPASINSSVRTTVITHAETFLGTMENAQGIFFFTFRVSPANKTYLYEVNAGLSGDTIAENLLKQCFPNFDPFKFEVNTALGYSQKLPEDENPTDICFEANSVSLDQALDEYYDRLKRFKTSSENISLNQLPVTEKGFT